MASSYDKTLRDHFGIQPTKHISRKSSFLKDYLMDDLSSCSSNGFNSFPRNQNCCTTMGQRKRTINTTLPKKSHSTSSSLKISALYRASEAVINSLKSFPLSQKNSTRGKAKKKGASSFLCRSFSRKVLLSSRRWMRYFRELLVTEEEDKTTSNKDITFIVNVSALSSWGESEFTFSSSESSAENQNVDGTGVTTRDWPNEEKEQLSPVSILDCPFEDDEEITSHFNSTVEGTQIKHNQKNRHFKGIASVEPIILEKRMIDSELEVETYELRSSLFPSTVTLEERMARSNLEVETYESRPFVFPSSVTLGEMMVRSDIEVETYESKPYVFPSSVTLEEMMSQCDLEVEAYESKSSISPFSVTLEELMAQSNLEVETYESKSSPFPCSADSEEKIIQSKLDVETYESKYSLFPSSSTLVPTICTQNVTTNMLSNNLDDNVLDLLSFIKKPTPSNYFITKAENLLIDYFKQTIEENNNNIDHSKKLHFCEVAEDWIIGQPQEPYLGWEMKEGRHVYIMEMDKEWKNSDQQLQQVTHELQNEVLTSLINELTLDLMMQQLSSSIGFSIL